MLNCTGDFNFSKIFFSLLVVTCVFFLPLYSFSYPEQAPPHISEVVVKVDGVEENDMREMIAIRIGDKFSLRKINEVIKYIYRIGAFSDVKVLKTGGESIQLTFLLTKKLFTRRIVFTGDKRIPKRKLRGSLYSLHENTPFSERKVLKALEEIRETLHEEGYLHPEVKSSSEGFQASSVTVIFNISLGRRYEIKKIGFVGDILFPEGRLRREMKSREGEVYIPSVIERDIERLNKMYQSKGYQRASVELEGVRFNEEETGVFLSLRVNPMEKIEIQVKGADVPLDLLRPVWEGEVFEEWGLQEGESKIGTFLRKKGHLFPTITSAIERTENVIKVIYNVKPGEAYRIEDVQFEGLRSFSSSGLKRELELRRKIPFLSWISGQRIFELPREIELLYKNHGFPQTRVNLSFEIKGKGAKAIFRIEEGRQEKVENIAIEGAMLFSEETLLGQIGSRAGGPYYQVDVQKDVDKLENFYLNQGTRGTEASAMEERKTDDLVSIRFTIREGKRVKIEKIVITGIVATRRRTILKELRIQEGDFAYMDKILETKRRLEGLGIFSEIAIEEVPLTPEAANLVISVREGQRNYAGVGLGLETKSELYSFAIWNNVIRPRGTAEYIRSNVVGTASQLSLVAQLSFTEKRAVASWEQPYLFGLPWQSYVNAWIENEDRTSFNYDRRGVSFTAMKNVSESLVLLTTVRWARTTLYNLQIAESEIDRQHTPFSASSISGSFIWDRRDDPFNPQRGFFLSFVAEWAYPLFKAESDYLKNFIKFQHFLPILPGFGFYSTFRLGFGTGKIPIQERFFAGGGNSFRGEKFDELGPKDPQSHMPRGGKALVLGNFELRFPLHPAVKDLSAALFYDTGNVFPEIRNLSFSSFQHALGFGLRYKTPLGPVRLDFGLNLSSPERRGKLLVFAAIGNVF